VLIEVLSSLQTNSNELVLLNLLYCYDRKEDGFANV